MDLKKVSRYLYTIFKYKPETIQKDYDIETWISVDTVLSTLSKNNYDITFNDLVEIVDTIAIIEKNRDAFKLFEFTPDRKMMKLKNNKIINGSAPWNTKSLVKQECPDFLFCKVDRNDYFKALVNGVSVKRGTRYIELYNDDESHLYGTHERCLGVDMRQLRGNIDVYYVGGNIWVIEAMSIPPECLVIFQHSIRSDLFRIVSRYYEKEASATDLIEF